MQGLVQSSCNNHVRISLRNSSVGGRLAPQAPRTPPCHAVRREIERVSFSEVYQAMQERVATSGTLPKLDGRVLVDSVRSLENAQRVLALIARHVASKREMAGALELDWPVRKKWLAHICELALRMPNSKPLILDVFANAETFGLSTYFAAEMVEKLAAEGADVALMTRVVELFRAQRPAGDKGVASAYHRLLAVLRARKDEAASKAASAALKEFLRPAKPPAAEPPAAEPVTVPAAAPPPPPPVAAPLPTPVASNA